MSYEPFRVDVALPQPLGQLAVSGVNIPRVVPEKISVVDWLEAQIMTQLPQARKLVRWAVVELSVTQATCEGNYEDLRVSEAL